jgi:HSP20 family protein
MMKLDDLRQGVGTLWDSVTEGWERLRQGAAGALTRYRPEHKASLPTPDEVDDASYLPSASWAMLGGDVFEDDERIVVRLEAPGMNKSDFDIQVLDGALVVRGEKRFEREATEGRWRVLQCAYGSFLRTVPLPVAVKGDQARAGYRNGVLKVELPKLSPGRPTVTQITVS